MGVMAKITSKELWNGSPTRTGSAFSLPHRPGIQE